MKRWLSFVACSRSDAIQPAVKTEKDEYHNCFYQNSKKYADRVDVFVADSS